MSRARRRRPAPRSRPTLASARSGRWVGTASTPGMDLTAAARALYRPCGQLVTRHSRLESPRGPVRPNDPAPARRGAHRDRSLRARPHAAVEPRRAGRPLLPGLRNSRYPYIDVKAEQEELTELVEVEGDEAFILHPGEFVGSTLERVTLPDDPRRAARGKRSARPARAPDPLDRRLHRPWLGRARHARALERRQPPDHDLPGMKIGQLSFVQLSEPAERPYRTEGIGSKYQGQKGPTPSRLEELLARRRALSVGVAGTSTPAPASLPRSSTSACSPASGRGRSARRSAGWASRACRASRGRHR